MNTGKGAVPGGFQLNVGYEGQRFSGGEPVNSLVYTNLPPERASYTAERSLALRNRPALGTVKTG